MHEFIKRDVDKEDIEKLLLLANNIFRIHGWRKSTIDNNCSIHYCGKCSMKFLELDGSRFYDINKTIKSIATIEHSNAYRKYSCDEWLIKSIIE